MENKKIFASKLNVYSIAYIAILISITIILSRFLSIYIPGVVKLSLGFIPIALCGYLFGVVPTIIVAGLSDFIGAHLFPIGAYFVGYTITSLVAGFLYGAVLYKDGIFKNKDHLFRAILCCVLVTLICNTFLNTVWSAIFFGKAFFALLLARIPAHLLQLPIRIVLIYIICKTANKSGFERIIR